MTKISFYVDLCVSVKTLKTSLEVYHGFKCIKSNYYTILKDNDIMKLSKLYIFYIVVYHCDIKNNK